MAESLKTIGAHIADLRITIRQTSDDSNLSDEYLYKLLSDTRALLLHRDMMQNRKISEWNYQTFCTKLEKSTYHDCSCVADPECYVMKSLDKVPKPLHSRNKNYFKVYNITQELELYKTTPMKLKRDKYSNTRFGLPGYDIVNEKLVVFNQTGMNTVLIRGVFEDPALAALTSACTDTQSCTNILEAEFPLDTRLNAMMKEMIIKQLSIVLQLPEDNTNNADTTTAKSI